MTSSTESLHRNEAQQRNIEVEATTLTTRREELDVRLERDAARASELDGLLPGLELSLIHISEPTRPY